MKIKYIFIVCMLVSYSSIAQESNQRINIYEFKRLSNEVESYRSSRLIDIETFNKYAKSKKTIILDCRSKQAYDAIHIAGAIHLNFSDFTKESLTQIIPKKRTRILIYCNNNFNSRNPFLLPKSPGLALNIPSFINLYGYGYKNIYELSTLLEENDPRVQMVGSSISKTSKQE